MMFVAAPLASTGDFTEVQVVFYPFNKRAGAMGVIDDGATPANNICEFPINIEEFQESFTAAAFKRKTPNMSVQEFIHYLGNNFVDDVTSPAYGLNLRRDSSISTPDQKGNVKVKKKKGQKAQLASIPDQALSDLGVPDGVFKMPLLNVFLETFPSRGMDTGPVKTQDPTKTILRVHIFDRAASSHDTAMSMLASKAGRFKLLKKDPNEITEADAQLASGLMGEMLKQGIMVPLKGNQKSPGFLIKGPASSVKAIIKSSMPNITYGTQASIIKNCSVSTMTNSELSTIFMLGSGGSGSPLAPTGAQASGLPLRAMPTRMSMTIVGCPLIEYGQQFFIDFGTGTTVDNIYTVTRVSHRISQGNFETDLDFIITDGYGQYESIANQVAVLKSVAQGGDF